MRMFVRTGPNFAVEFSAVGCRGHGVDWGGISVVLLRSIKYLAILLVGFDEHVLKHDEAMWNKVPNPVQGVEDIIVAFFYVHGARTRPSQLKIEGWLPIYQ